MKMTAKFHLPGLRYNYPLNMMLLSLKEKYPHYFQDNIEIASFFGEFPTSLWNGGRFSNGDQCDRRFVEEVVKSINTRGIPVRYTYTNPLLTEEDLADAFHTASREAESAFGNGDVFLEKYLTHVRHVEMQILADQQGNILCLGERDCSLQLNKQKVLEETPSPVMTEDIRRKMMDAAVLAAKAANYTNAGTVEFLLAPDGQFYFIEMNTRLQVEHPITEEISGVDIVKWQIRIACQVPLNMKQEDIRLQGHAIECRINARSTGRVEFLHIPGGGRVHFDTALMQDTVVVPFYDSMLGKLIVHANTREEAIRRMEASLCEMVIVGVETNIEEQLQLIRSKIFQKGNYDTLILDKILKKG